VAASLSASGASAYTWTPGGTGSTIVVNPAVSTTYTVTGSFTTGCGNSATITQVVDGCTFVKVINAEASALLIYPNPSRGKYIVEWPGTPGLLRVLNTTGQEIYSCYTQENRTHLDLSEYPAGIYFVQFTGKEGAVMMKLVKE
jgi:hypothetical protein